MAQHINGVSSGLHRGRAPSTLEVVAHEISPIIDEVSIEVVHRGEHPALPGRRTSRRRPEKGRRSNHGRNFKTGNPRYATPKRRNLSGEETEVDVVGSVEIARLSLTGGPTMPRQD